MTNYEAIKSAIANMDLDELAYFCYNYPDYQHKFGFYCKGKLLCDKDFSCIECFKNWLCRKQYDV